MIESIILVLLLCVLPYGILCIISKIWLQTMLKGLFTQKFLSTTSSIEVYIKRVHMKLLLCVRVKPTLDSIPVLCRNYMHAFCLLIIVRYVFTDTGTHCIYCNKQDIQEYRISFIAKYCYVNMIEWNYFVSKMVKRYISLKRICILFNQF